MKQLRTKIVENAANAFYEKGMYGDKEEGATKQFDPSQLGGTNRCKTLDLKFSCNTTFACGSH